MTIQKIIGEHGPLDRLCNNGQCPAVIVGGDGDAYIQGYELGAGEKATLTAPVGEGFVRIPMATLKKIAAQVVSI